MRDSGYIYVRISQPFTICHNNQVKWHYWQKLDLEFSATCINFYYTEYYYCFVWRFHLNFVHDQLRSAIDIVIVLEMDLMIMIRY